MTTRWYPMAAAFCLILAAPFVAAQSTRPFTIAEGQQTFRFDTFGDEQLWTDTLQLHTAVATISPTTALEVGLKVDLDALPPAIVDALRMDTVDLSDPTIIRQLLELNAVVGVKATVSGNTLTSIGITCALCHSTVDDALMTGIGHRLDGWPNRDLNVGRIVALSPVLTDEQRAVFRSWGPGKFDPRLQAFDGTQLVSLNSTTLPVVIPPAYGLRRVPFETFTGDGPISYWNNYVGVTQMGGHGNFSDPRLALPPIVQTQPDLVTPKLPALREYQLSLLAPAPPRGSFDRAAARRGEELFGGAAGCAACHQPPAFTDVGLSATPGPLLHAPVETDVDPGYANRSATGLYRTSPLRGIWQHPPYFHDGSAADLAAVVSHYNTVLSLGLTAGQQADLVEYLKSL